MRDEHRPKQELIHEITGLRKQVGDLKEAMTARRRVEDALRGTATLLRNLTDGAPVGLCLFGRDGTVLTSNERFARMLGYASPAELQSLSAVIGVFASPEDQAQALECPCPGGALRPARFRRKDGCRLVHGIMAGMQLDSSAVVLAVFDCVADSFPTAFPTPSA
jgi:PAS domain S-box-containing protein